MANNGVGSIDQVRKKLTYTHDLISTSYHEAGHAVYGLLHFMKVPSVYVFENKKNKRIEGFCHYESVKELSEVQDIDLFAEQLKAEICIKYAGLTAEKYHFKTISGSDKFPMFLKDGSSDDTLSAAALIKQYEVVPPGRKRYAFKKKMITETLRDLQENWDAVTLIAHGLFQKKRLSFPEIEKLLSKKTDNKEFWKEQFKTIHFIFDNIEGLDEKDLKSILLP
jgi:hypothetical protein